MDIRRLILRKLAKKKTLKASDIVRATGFSRAYINRFFQELQNEGKIVLLGKANRSRYASTKTARGAKKELLSVSRILKNKNLSEDLVLDGIKQDTGIFLDLSKNIANIIDYSFTEMLNNAIEHSRSSEIAIQMKRDKSGISFEVVDSGIGIFR